VHCSIPAVLTGDRAHGRRLSSAAGLRPFFANLERLENGQCRRRPGSCKSVIAIPPMMRSAAGCERRYRPDWGRRAAAGCPAASRSCITGRSWSGSSKRAGPNSGWVPASSPKPSGVNATIALSQGRDSRMALVSSEVEGFNQFAIEFLAQPNGGVLSIRADQRQPISVRTSASTTRVKRCVVPIGEPAHQVELRTVDEWPVHVIGWTTERQQVAMCSTAIGISPM
jgi:hypothetical protein